MSHHFINKSELFVTVKNVYGVERIYPACDTSKTLVPVFEDAIETATVAAQGRIPVDYPKSLNVRFSLNQVGLLIEAMDDRDGEWQGIDLIKLEQPCYAEQFIEKWLADRKWLGMELKVVSKNLG